MEQGRESGRLGRAVARGEAASPADLVVRLPEARDVGEGATVWQEAAPTCLVLL